MKKSSVITLKTIIALLISIDIANYFLINILENLPINIWIARGIGLVICIIVGLILYAIWIKKENKILDYLFALLVSIEVANFVLINILEKLPINIWIARGIGTCICVVIGVVLYQLWLKKSSLLMDQLNIVGLFFVFK